MSTEIKAQNQTALASVKAIYDAAEEANTLLGGMQEAAEQAGTTLEGIYQDAEQAKTSAESASEYAARALGNLSTVQNVTETLNWITAHGTMTLTTDTALDPSHVYFVADPNGDYTVGGNRYSVVTEPDVSDISTYYELSIDESLQNYVGTHLAVTSEGLWLIPEEGATPTTSSKKVLIAVGGTGHTYKTAGTYIIEKVNGTDTVIAKFAADGAQIGQNSEDRISVASGEIKLITKDGVVPFMSSSGGGGVGYQTVVIRNLNTSLTRNGTITLEAALPDTVAVGESINILFAVASKTSLMPHSDGTIASFSTIYTTWSASLVRGTSSSETLTVPYASGYDLEGERWRDSTGEISYVYNATLNTITVTASSFPYETLELVQCQPLLDGIYGTRATSIPITTISGEFNLDLGNIYVGSETDFTVRGAMGTEGTVWIGTYKIETTAGDFSYNPGDILFVQFEHAPSYSQTLTSIMFSIDGLNETMRVVDWNGDNLTPTAWSAGDTVAFRYSYKDGQEEDHPWFYMQPANVDVDVDIASALISLGWEEDCLGIPI